MTSNNHTFGDAITAARSGKRISRPHYEGFVFMQVPSEVPEAIVPKMSSLPQEVKALLVKRGGPLRYTNQFAYVFPTNDVMGWSPQPEDALAQDWIIWEDDLTADLFEAAPVAETAGTAKLL